MTVRVRVLACRSRRPTPARPRVALASAAPPLRPARQRAGAVPRAAARRRGRGPVLVVAPDATTAEAFAADLRFFAGERERGRTARPSRALPARVGGPAVRAAVAHARDRRRTRRGPLPPPADPRSGRRDAPSRRSASAACPARCSPPRSPTWSRARRWRRTRSPSGSSSGVTTACRWCRIPATWRSAAASSTSSRPATPGRSDSSSSVTTSSACASSIPSRSARSTASRRCCCCRCASSAARASAQPAARLVDERAAEIGLARQERRELVEAVRSGLAVPGIEFLLPYLYDELATLADYLPAGTLVLDAGRGCDRRRGRDRLDAGDEPRRGGAARRPLLPAAGARSISSRARGARVLAGRPRVEVESLEELAGGRAARRRRTRPTASRCAAGPRPTGRWRRSPRS